MSDIMKLPDCTLESLRDFVKSEISTHGEDYRVDLRSTTR